MLTTGQLAAYTGVTVRAVRHYHQRGLLAEPARDASGYRRYDGRAAVELIRIKTLAEAGMALARIRVLLDAEPGEFGEAVTQVGEALKKKTRDYPGAAA
jgi:DNA-binding transcriptional MerR regulator